MVCVSVQNREEQTGELMMHLLVPIPQPRGIQGSMCSQRSSRRCERATFQAAKRNKIITITVKHHGSEASGEHARAGKRGKPERWLSRCGSRNLWPCKRK